MALLFPCNLLKINANQKPETNSVPNVSIGGTSAPAPRNFRLFRLVLSALA